MAFTLDQIKVDLPVGAVVIVHYNTGRRFDKDPEKVERRVYGLVKRTFPLTVCNHDPSLDVPSDAAFVRIELEEILDYEVFRNP